MRGLPARTILLSILAAGGFSGAALADAIDGDWCKSGQQFTIRGPEIVTPAGSAILGNHDRHAFAYIVPENEPDAGTEIYMRQLNEETLHLMVGSWNADAEIWRRCDFVS